MSAQTSRDAFRGALLSLSLLFSFHPVAAQSSYVTSPPGYLSTEGELSSYWLGNMPSGRYMLFDGELRGNAMKIMEVAFRQEYSKGTWQGRTWTNVTLHISDCDLNSISTTFSQNPLSTPARVFSSSVTWPTKTSYPATKPAPWGGKNGAFSFPFSNPWFYSGKQDICLDFAFSTGILLNNNPTGSFYYRLDSRPSYRKYGTSTAHGRLYYSRVVGCKDSGNKDFSEIGATGNAKTYPSNPYGSSFSLTTSTVHTAPSKPVVHGIGFAGTKTGMSFPGLSCVKLYVDPNKPIIFVYLIALPRGSAMFQATVPYDPAFVGKTMWFQAGWDDSITGRFLLTNAVSMPWPEAPRLYKKMSLHNPLGYPHGRGPNYGYLYDALTRYTK